MAQFRTPSDASMKIFRQDISEADIFFVCASLALGKIRLKYIPGDALSCVLYIWRPNCPHPNGQIGVLFEVLAFVSKLGVILPHLALIPLAPPAPQSGPRRERASVLRRLGRSPPSTCPIIPTQPEKRLRRKEPDVGEETRSVAVTDADHNGNSSNTGRIDVSKKTNSYDDDNNSVSSTRPT